MPSSTVPLHQRDEADDQGWAGSDSSGTERSKDTLVEDAAGVELTGAGGAGGGGGRGAGGCCAEVLGAGGRQPAARDLAGGACDASGSC